MTKNKVCVKYNESCIKIFSLISLFIEGEAVFNDVIKLFANPDGTLAQKSNVLLNKYMNTLEIFGIQIKKEKNKYYLIKMPFSLSFSEEELYAIALLKSALNFLPNGKNKRNIKYFISELEKRYDFETKKLNIVISQTRNYDLSFYFMRFEKQIESCENYCQEGNKIDILYSDENSCDVHMICTPLELKYFDSIVCFSVFDSLSRQIYDIPIDKIKNINSIKLNADKVRTCTTVMFRIKGDLVKRYKLREWEKLEKTEEDGSQIIVNSGEDFKSLSVRLFKYGTCCEILTPKYLRLKIAKMVSNTLKNYM